MAVDRQAPIGFDAWIGHPRAMERPHQHGDLEANYLISGSMVYLVGGRLVEVPLGRLWLVWGAIPHRLIEVRGEATCGWVTIPLGQALRWRLPAPFLAALLSGMPVIDAGAESDGLASIARWSDDCRRRGPSQREIAALEVEARIRRLALAWAPVPGALGGDGTLAKVAAMAAYIAEHHAEALAVATIARQVRLNPTYAMTVFRRHTGMTLNDYMTRFRVATAQRLLATGDLSVLDAGLQAGFGSSSRFHEAFTAVTGLPPGRWRRQV